MEAILCHFALLEALEQCCKESLVKQFSLNRCRRPRITGRLLTNCTEIEEMLLLSVG